MNTEPNTPNTAFDRPANIMSTLTSEQRMNVERIQSVDVPAALLLSVLSAEQCIALFTDKVDQISKIVDKLNQDQKYTMDDHRDFSRTLSFGWLLGMIKDTLTETDQTILLQQKAILKAKMDEADGILKSRLDTDVHNVSTHIRSLLNNATI